MYPVAIPLDRERSSARSGVPEWDIMINGIDLFFMIDLAGMVGSQSYG